MPGVSVPTMLSLILRPLTLLLMPTKLSPANFQTIQRRRLMPSQKLGVFTSQNHMKNFSPAEVPQRLMEIPPLAPFTTAENLTTQTQPLAAPPILHAEQRMPAIHGTFTRNI
jgi:hypothetical protein